MKFLVFVSAEELQELEDVWLNFVYEFKYLEDENKHELGKFAIWEGVHVYPVGCDAQNCRPLSHNQ